MRERDPVTTAPQRSRPPSGISSDPDRADGRDADLDVPLEERILLLLPDDDAAFARGEIRKAGLTAHRCGSVGALCRAMVDGAGLAVIGAEAIVAGMAELFEVLDGQQTWSDLPVVVLVDSDAPPKSLAAMRAFERHPKIKTTFLQRPVPALSLISAVRSGLQSRRRQYQVRDLLRRLNDEVRSRDAFLAMLGHELRNPVTSIGYVAEIFDMHGEQLSPERLRWGAGVINRQVAHLSRLLDQLLDVARVQSGKIEIETAPVDLRVLVRESAEAFASAAKGRRFEVDLGERPIVVRGDRVRLAQAIDNLLDNALKFTSERGSISVGLHVDGQAVLTVADDGRGMKEDVLPHVFKPFYQDIDGARGGGGGLGLGLAMVDNIVRLHGGSVAARSEGAHCGAAFEIRLPLEPERSADAVERSSPTPPLRVLIIEDDHELADVFATLLASLGNEPHVAHAGREGEALASRLRPDVVFIDLGLPDIDGREVARRIRETCGTAAPPLVALTGYAREESAEGLFDDYLLKPVGRDRVEQVLRELAARRAALKG